MHACLHKVNPWTILITLATYTVAALKNQQCQGHYKEFVYGSFMHAKRILTKWLPCLVDHAWTKCGIWVCLFNRSARADTRMGPEGTKLKQKPEPGLKSPYIACRLWCRSQQPRWTILLLATVHEKRKSWYHLIWLNIITDLLTFFGLIYPMV